MSDNESRPSQDQPEKDTTGYPQLARVVGHLDNTYNGKIQVELLRTSGNTISESQVQTVKMISPFFGVTSKDYLSEDPDFNGTQKSYGMWMIPPDVGSIVVVIFINGNSKDGYWLGGVPMGDMNFMTPGLAATSFNIEGTAERVPVGEFNKNLNPDPGTDTTRVPKPEHPFAKVLDHQGLLKDDIRGITSSSARRESPSMVFGISTPGPLDKQDGAPRGKMGTKESFANVPVSRLGGTTFVMDDGDDKYIRKTPAGGEKQGPPEYISVEDDGPGEGEVTLPHNELVRIRTRTGHQILMHNSEDLIYITNSRGTAWIELTSNGKIDIYSKDSISVHSETDLNFTAGRDINFTAGTNAKDFPEGGNMNINLTKKFLTKTGASWEIKVGAAGKITTAANLDLKVGAAANINPAGDCNIAAANTTISGGNINLNGPAAGTATAAADALKTARVPQTEPWKHHENLDPKEYEPEKTKAGSAEPAVPKFFEKYTTTKDTFDRPPAPATDEEQQEAGE